MSESADQVRTTSERSTRLTHLDLIRGVAVLGILLMNIVSYAFRGPSYFDISLPENQTQLDWWVGAFGEVFADQKFMALFSLLFGASVLLFLERAELKTDKPVNFSLWRNFLLLLIGLVHLSLWEGDILTVYALCAPFLLALRRLPGRALIILGLILYSASGISNYLMAIIGTDQVLHDVWAGNLPTPLHDTIGLIFITDAFTRASGMMLLGMGLYKTGYLKDPSRALKHRPLALGALLAGGLASTLGLLWSHQHDYSAASILIGNIANTVGTIPMSLGYLVFLITWDHKGTSWILDPLRRLGQSALTNYLGQTILCLVLVNSLPRELLSRSLLLAMVLVVWLVQVKASSVWLSQFRFGPIEWLWRSATYRRLEPLRRAPS